MSQRKVVRFFQEVGSIEFDPANPEGMEEMVKRATINPVTLKLTYVGKELHGIIPVIFDADNGKMN